MSGTDTVCAPAKAGALGGKAEGGLATLRPSPEHGVRVDWTRAEIATLFARPLMDLVFEAQGVHRRHHAPNEVQLSTLLSIKTGGCPEDCAHFSHSLPPQT